MIWLMSFIPRKWNPKNLEESKNFQQIFREYNKNLEKDGK